MKFISGVEDGEFEFECDCHAGGSSLVAVVTVTVAVGGGDGGVVVDTTIPVAVVSILDSPSVKLSKASSTVVRRRFRRPSTEMYGKM